MIRGVEAFGVFLCGFMKPQTLNPEPCPRRGNPTAKTLPKSQAEALNPTPKLEKSARRRLKP